MELDSLMEGKIPCWSEEKLDKLVDTWRQRIWNLNLDWESVCNLEWYLFYFNLMNIYGEVTEEFAEENHRKKTEELS